MRTIPRSWAVGELLAAAGIIPVFAVTEYVVPYYQQLVDLWGFGSVTVLSADSGNLATAITDGLKAATTDLGLTISGDDYGYVSSMAPTTYEDVGVGSYTFDITLEIPEDSIDYSSDGMTLVIDGYGEVAVEIAIESVDATGDSGDDTLSGDDGVNGLYGLAGADTLDGRGGDDTLDGGSGDDTMTARPGRRQLRVRRRPWQRHHHRLPRRRCGRRYHRLAPSDRGGLLHRRHGRRRADRRTTPSSTSATATRSPCSVSTRRSWRSRTFCSKRRFRVIRFGRARPSTPRPAQEFE